MWIAKIRSKIVNEWRDFVEQPPLFSVAWFNRMLDDNRRQVRMNSLRITWWSWLGDTGFILMSLGLLVDSSLSSTKGVSWKLIDCAVFAILMILVSVAIAIRRLEITALTTMERLSKENQPSKVLGNIYELQ